MATTTAVTAKEYGSFQTAYDVFNKELFDGKLPHAMITLQRHAGAKGYFAAERFSGRQGDARVHEIALNPDTFEGRTDAEILSTLAHEMVHLWQQEFGRAPRTCYHDRQWANRMKEIGLQPSTTGDPSDPGKETGPKVTHLILPDGRYLRVVEKLLAKGLKLQWQSDREWGGKAAKAAKAASKTKYTCPECEQNCWAKPGANLMCGDCEEVMEVA